jgi:hypothetical protein
MKLNVGSVDRIIRVVLGIALGALGLFGVVNGALMYVFYVVAAVFIITGAIGFCPLYALFKLSTAKK